MNLSMLLRSYHIVLPYFEKLISALSFSVLKNLSVHPKYAIASSLLSHTLSTLCTLPTDRAISSPLSDFICLIRFRLLDDDRLLDKHAPVFFKCYLPDKIRLIPFSGKPKRKSYCLLCYTYTLCQQCYYSLFVQYSWSCYHIFIFYLLSLQTAVIFFVLKTGLLLITVQIYKQCLLFKINNQTKIVYFIYLTFSIDYG